MQCVLFLMLICASGLQAVDIQEQTHHDAKLYSIYKRNIVGDVYLVPNAACKASECSDGCSRFQNGWNVLTKDGQPLSVAEDDYCVEVWATHVNCDRGYRCEHENKEVSCNWAAHGHPALGKFTYQLPYSMLRDKKEGDLIKLYYQNAETKEIFKVYLICKQLAYRYQGAGAFETCLAKMMDKAVEVESWWKQEKLGNSALSEQYEDKIGAENTALSNKSETSKAPKSGGLKES